MKFSEIESAYKLTKLVFYILIAIIGIFVLNYFYQFNCDIKRALTNILRPNISTDP